MTTNRRSTPSTISATVIQMECNDEGDFNANCDKFALLIEQAINSDEGDSTEGDDKNNNGINKCSTEMNLVLGPEFALCGYCYNEQILWGMGEPRNGVTERFLCALAREHQIYVGLSYLEVREISLETEMEAHFFNTFALAGPDGTIQGRVSKGKPCSVEAYFFRGPESPCHVITCDNGIRVGVLICYDNFCHDAVGELYAVAGDANDRIDVLLQPFSGPLADNKTPAVREGLLEMYRGIGPMNAQLLQCPALYANKIGRFQQPCPSTVVPLQFDSEYPGESMICDATGKILVQMDATSEGSTTTLLNTQHPKNHCTTTAERKQLVRYWGGFTHPAPWLKVCLVLEWLGARSYIQNGRRLEMAQAALRDDDKPRCR